jgi:hypothetical protein
VPRRPPTTVPPRVSPWLGFSGTALGTSVLLVAIGAWRLLGDGDEPSIDPESLAVLAAGLLLVAVLRRVHGRLVVAELVRWSRPAADPEPRALPLLAGWAALVALLVATSAWVAAPVALLVVALGCALTPRGRRALRTTVATFALWSLLGGALGSLTL